MKKGYRDSVIAIISDTKQNAGKKKDQLLLKVLASNYVSFRMYKKTMIEKWNNRRSKSLIQKNSRCDLKGRK